MRHLMLLVLGAVSVLFGLFLFLNPALAIEVQRKFYKRINWRIEPISMQKEIRNTKIMGLFLIALTLLIVVYVFTGS
jgi:hypothetical protein